MKAWEETEWAEIRLVKPGGTKESRGTVEVKGSDPAAVLKGMAELVEQCAERMGLSTVGVLGRITVIVMGEDEDE